MYCLLKNTCKYEYKCCNYCKQVCQDRCTDKCVGCKFFTKTEPTFVHKFTINGQQICAEVKKDSKIKGLQPIFGHFF